MIKAVEDQKKIHRLSNSSTIATLYQTHTQHHHQTPIFDESQSKVWFSWRWEKSRDILVALNPELLDFRVSSTCTTSAQCAPPRAPPPPAYLSPIRRLLGTMAKIIAIMKSVFTMKTSGQLLIMLGFLKKSGEWVSSGGDCFLFLFSLLRFEVLVVEADSGSIITLLGFICSKAPFRKLVLYFRSLCFLAIRSEMLFSRLQAIWKRRIFSKPIFAIRRFLGPDARSEGWTLDMITGPIHVVWC